MKDLLFVCMDGIEIDDTEQKVYVINKLSSEKQILQCWFMDLIKTKDDTVRCGKLRIEDYIIFGDYENASNYCP